METVAERVREYRVSNEILDDSDIGEHSSDKHKSDYDNDTQLLYQRTREISDNKDENIGDTLDIEPGGGKKGKAIPLQAWRGPEGSRTLILSDFKTIGTCRW